MKLPSEFCDVRDPAAMPLIIGARASVLWCSSDVSISSEVSDCGGRISSTGAPPSLRPMFASASFSVVTTVGVGRNSEVGKSARRRRALKRGLIRMLCFRLFARLRRTNNTASAITSKNATDVPTATAAIAPAERPAGELGALEIQCKLKF